MKKSLLVLLCLGGLLWVSPVFSQNFTLSVQNQQVSGTDFIFDIYLLRTGSTELYLGNADLVLTFNSANFTSPTYVKVSSGSGMTWYTVSAAAITDGNKAILNISQPPFSDQGEFDARVVNVSNTGNGTHIAQVKITGISNPAGTAGLAWRTETPNKTIVNTLASADPWASTDVSANGTYTNPSDYSLPVQLYSFSAEPVDKGVMVRWTTQSETDNLGFILERAVSGDWQEIASYQNHDELKGQGNTSASTDYAFLDEDAPFGQVVQYRLSDVNTAGEVHVYDVLQITLEVRPEATVLKPAYPNPFNPETKINYELAERSEVRLVVYDLLGRKVKTLVSQPQAIGSYDLFWQADDESGRPVASGMYLLVLNAGKTVKTQKVTVVR